MKHNIVVFAKKSQSRRCVTNAVLCQSSGSYRSTVLATGVEVHKCFAITFFETCARRKSTIGVPRLCLFAPVWVYLFAIMGICNDRNSIRPVDYFQKEIPRPRLRGCSQFYPNDKMLSVTYKRNTQVCQQGYIQKKTSDDHFKRFWRSLNMKWTWGCVSPSSSIEYSTANSSWVIRIYKIPLMMIENPFTHRSKKLTVLRLQLSTLCKLCIAKSFITGATEKKKLSMAGPRGMVELYLNFAQPNTTGNIILCLNIADMIIFSYYYVLRHKTLAET